MTHLQYFVLNALIAIRQPETTDYEKAIGKSFNAALDRGLKCKAPQAYNALIVALKNEYYNLATRPDYKVYKKGDGARQDIVKFVDSQLMKIEMAIIASKNIIDKIAKRESLDETNN